MKMDMNAFVVARWRSVMAAAKEAGLLPGDNKVVLEDDFGSKLVTRKGAIPADIELKI
jgi:hypothetical protein